MESLSQNKKLVQLLLSSQGKEFLASYIIFLFNGAIVLASGDRQFFLN